MFRIARVRIRWINTNQHSASAVLPTPPALVPDSSISLRRPWMFNPQHLRARVSWVGFVSTESSLSTAPTSVGMVERSVIPSSGRVLGSFDIPGARLRVLWLGFGSVNRGSVWVLGVLAVLLLGLFAFPRLAHRSDTNYSLDTEKVVPAGLIADDIALENETIRLIHSPIDIGQARDVFDHNIDTLVRGREANPFILDLEFAQPQVISGLVMDFGRMDFVMRVQVYGMEGSRPISYQGEYRQQPDIPHLDMDFVHGPDRVRRIYIEIEQLNPPDEVHIHVREIGFKK